MWAIGPEIQQVINKWKIQNIYSCDRLTHHYHPLEFLISQAHYCKMNTHNLFLFIFVLLLLFIQSSVQSLHRVRLFATPWSAARQASLYITNSQSLLKLISIELVMPFNHLILCHPILCLPAIFPSITVFSNESVLCIRWPNYGVSASAWVLPMKTLDWSPLGWTGWIPLQSKGLSRLFSNTTVPKHQFFGAQLSL